MRAIFLIALIASACGGAAPQSSSAALGTPTTVSGHVVFNGSTLSAPHAMAGVTVKITPLRIDALTPAPPPVGVEADGAFKVTGVAPGTYWLSASVEASAGEEPAWTILTVTSSGRDALDVPVSVRSGEPVTDAVVTMTDRPTHISGVLRDAAGQTTGNAYVVLIPVARTAWSRGSPRLHDPVRPDAEGHYEIRGFPPGSYLIKAVPTLDLATWTEPESLDRLAAGALRTTLLEGSRRGQALILR